jgi:hypothetical protein
MNFSGFRGSQNNGNFVSDFRNMKSYDKPTRMKLLFAFAIALCSCHEALSQSLVGTWQLTEEKTCFQSELQESSTELELKGAMGASREAVAKIITFNKKGTYEEGIYSQGKKRGSNVNKYDYRLTGKELQLLDKKSGMATQRFIIDELSASTLRFHNVMKDCEIKTFTRVD